MYGTSSWRPVSVDDAEDNDSDDASAACLAMDSGKGSECLTMAPYKPYSAMTLQPDRPHVFSVLRHLARRFWNQTLTVTHH